MEVLLGVTKAGVLLRATKPERLGRLTNAGRRRSIEP